MRKTSENFNGSSRTLLAKRLADYYNIKDVMCGITSHAPNGNVIYFGAKPGRKMSYCHVHGTEYRYEDGCSECRDDVEAIREGHAEIKAAIAGSEYERANPGDYQCPFCGYITLKKGFSRCTGCHGNVGEAYWSDVRRKEAAAREAAEKARVDKKEKEAAEWKRTEPERLAAKRTRTIERRLGYLHLLWAVPISGIVGALAGELVGAIIGGGVESFTATRGANLGQNIGGWVGVLAAFVLVATTVHETDD